MARLLFIVAGDRPELFEFLRQELSREEETGTVQVILDRRQDESRRLAQPYEPERRRAERRQHPVNVEALRSHGFVVIRQASQPSGEGAKGC